MLSLMTITRERLAGYRVWDPHREYVGCCILTPPLCKGRRHGKAVTEGLSGQRIFKHLVWAAPTRNNPPVSFVDSPLYTRGYLAEAPALPGSLQNSVSSISLNDFKFNNFRAKAWAFVHAFCFTRSILFAMITIMRSALHNHNKEYCV